MRGCDDLAHPAIRRASSSHASRHSPAPSPTARTSRQGNSEARLVIKALVGLQEGRRQSCLQEGRRRLLASRHCRQSPPCRVISVGKVGGPGPDFSIAASRGRGSMSPSQAGCQLILSDQLENGCFSPQQGESSHRRDRWGLTPAPISRTGPAGTHRSGRSCDWINQARGFTPKLIEALVAARHVTVATTHTRACGL
jgi:hypothetical protein